MHKNIILFSILIIVASLIIIDFVIIRSCKNASCINYKGKDSYVETETYTRNNNSASRLFEYKELKVRIETFSDVSQAESDTKVEELATRISSQTDVASSPYPGEISNKIDCRDKYKVDFTSNNINNNNIVYGKEYLNNRFVSGACDEKENTYVGLLAFIYCPFSKTLAQVEFIAANDAAHDEVLNSHLQSLKCDKPLLLKIPCLN